MSRITRYQGAVIHDDQILLIKHHHHKSGREYWVLPGGGCEEDETEEECVKREIKEETNLEVVVERLLLDIPGQTDDKHYRFYKTYQCKPITIDAQPGSELEFATDTGFEISEMGGLTYIMNHTGQKILLLTILYILYLKKFNKS
jgi:ADP-ribose pyrophosphatase YjhB (NUDIX family)